MILCYFSGLPVRRVPQREARGLADANQGFVSLPRVMG